jgi:hypothetical protein
VVQIRMSPERAVFNDAPALLAEARPGAPSAPTLDGDRGMRVLEWLVVALCSVTVALVSLAH